MSHAVATLHKQTVALRDAIISCLAKPKPKCVHNLRTTARRIQAQLELIPLLPDAPKITAQSKRALKAIKPIRQAAGKVRDLDVHLDHLADLPKTADPEALAKILDQKRDRQADKLQRILHKRQAKLLAALDLLEAALVPARTLPLSPAQAGNLARSWFASSTAHLNPTDPAQFHELRKAAKLARYIAEAANAPSPTARRFNRIQQTSGDWHDWLTLTTFAGKHLDPSSPLLSILKQRRDRSHETALHLIRTSIPTLKPPRKTRAKS
jgi:CHAD domain-containing protein